MTEAQTLEEAANELRSNPRLLQMLKAIADTEANKFHRATFATNDASMLIRLSGKAEGVIHLLTVLTKARQ